MTILFKANLQVAREVITPGLGMSPRIIAYPVAGMTDGQITTFSNALTLTPDTLTTDVAEDGRTLYIHCMYAEDRDRAVAELDELRDRIMREVFE
jgi:multicomponent Na+:H+ antiporter subunit E